MTDKQVQILCNPDDKNKDTIAHRMVLLQEAVKLNNLVAIACYNGEQAEDVIMLAVITKDSGNDYVQYAPIGILFYPDDNSYTSLTPPESAISVEGNDVEH